ncbi:MAG: ABC-type uncharacterized transport system auxiliary subunit [Gammaproteobacteria bacterium]|jgi:ABC-type uncharacterized transport system auxiliary subunit
MNFLNRSETIRHELSVERNKVKLVDCHWSYVKLTAILIIALLPACGALKPLPSDRHYQLGVNHLSASVDSSRWTEEPIRVAKFQANGVHRERSIVRSESGKFAVQQLRYDLWVDSPERMLQTELVSYLRAANVAPVVSTSNVHRSGYEIAGRILRFEQVVDGDGTSIAVVLGLELAALKSPPTLVLAREYEEIAAAGNGDIEASVASISAAIETIFRRFVADAGTTLRQQ